MTKINSQVLEKLNEKGFWMGRMISGSKSGYTSMNPENIAVFNANIIIPEGGKIWYGDLDLTKSGDLLKQIANECNTTIYVLREMDARFENENKSAEEFIKKAVWNTQEEVPSRKK